MIYRCFFCTFNRIIGKLYYYMYKIAQVEVEYKLELHALFRYNKESTLMEGRVNSRRKVRGK